MTEDFVNFKATVEFGETETEKGTLVFEKQRAKGNESAAEFKVPVVFKQEKKAKPINWESLIPSIRTVLRQEFEGPPSDARIENSGPIKISEKADITGDGVPEALVDLGDGGATSEFFALMMIENNKPIAARFKQKDGKISSLMFIAAAGGAGRYGSGANLLSDKNAIYSASYSAHGESDDYCRVEAYQWNAQTKIFEFNLNLSNEIQPAYCQKPSPLIPGVE